MTPTNDPRDATAPPQSHRASMWRRYRGFWRVRIEDDVDDELRFHLEMRIRDFRAAGLSESEARAAALSKVGDVAIPRAECVTIANRRERAVKRTQMIDALLQDLAFALRTLGRQKAWTTVAVLTLAIGIGANTAVFSVVNAVLLNPLPYRDADRIVMLWRAQAATGVMMPPSPPMLTAWRGSHSLEAIEAYRPADATLLGRGDAAVVHTAAIGAGFVQFTGIRPLVGRGFTADETKPGAEPVAMLAEGIWHERFGASPDAIGQRIVLDGKSYTIVGVAPGAFRIPTMIQPHTDVWLPLVPDPKAYSAAAIARLRPGADIEAAKRELDSLTVRGVPAGPPGLPKFVAQLTRPGDVVPFRESLYLLWGAVALLMIIACANVAHLLLARGAARERELAIRTALGASRSRLVRQLLTESSLLAAAGCVAGLGAGYAMLRAFIAMRPVRLGQLALAQLDGPVLLVTIGASIATGLTFGLVGAMHAMRHVAHDSLKSATTTGTSHRHRVRSTLVVTEMALSAMLLVGAVLLVRSVINLQRVDPGFDTSNLYSLKLDPPAQRYPSAAARNAFVEQVVEQARRVPGVAAVTVAQSVPPETGYIFGNLDVEDGVAQTGAAAGANVMNSVPPDYFRLLGVKLLAGTAFDAGSAKRNDVIVNEGLAKQLWPGRTAVGHHLRFSSPGAKNVPWMTVVGVVGNVVTRGLSNERGEPLIYMPWESIGEIGSATVILRAREGSDPSFALRRAIVALDPKIAPPPVTTVDHALAESISSQRFTMALLTIFAGLAVLLSAIGLYGVIAYMVAQRTREIGIRIALGATPRLIARAVLARGVLLALVGLVLGLVGATWGSRAIRSMLYGVQPTDPGSYLAGGLLLLAIAMTACLVPMRRAMRVDPLIAMRAE